MEFEELKKIWDAPNQKVLYAIDEKALYNRITVKRRQALHITNISEPLLIVVNGGMGTFVVVFNAIRQSVNISLYLLAALMFGSAFYVLFNRINRIKGNNRFDRSMRGDLDYAVSVASYQVRLSQIMRWNFIPIGILLTLGIIEGGKSIWIAFGMLALFMVTYFLSSFEHKYYKNKKQELEELQKKLSQEDSF